MFGREPAVIIGGLADIVRAIIPMLLIFGVIAWTDQQTGAVIFFVGVLVGVAEKLFIRSQVVPTETANEQIRTAVSMPTGTSVKEVIAETEAQNK